MVVEEQVSLWDFLGSSLEIPDEILTQSIKWFVLEVIVCVV